MLILRLLIALFGLTRIVAAQPLLVMPPASSGTQQTSPSEQAVDRWAKEISQLNEHATKLTASKKRFIFVGSSSIRLWDLKASFPEQQPLNHGFGGSQMSDIVRHLDRLVINHQPEVVVLYSGDNDLAAKRLPRVIAADLQIILERIAEKLPQTRVIVLGVKPSEKREALRTEQDHTNTLLAAVVQSLKSDRFEFLDLGKLLLDEAGKPKTEYFRDDKLHLSAAGYAVWNEALQQRLSPRTTSAK